MPQSDKKAGSSNLQYLDTSLASLIATLGEIQIRDLMNGDMSGLVFVSLELQKLRKDLPSLVA